MLVRCGHKYHRESDADLIVTARKTSAGFALSTFTPPVDVTELNAFILTFGDLVQKAKSGVLVTTQTKNARKALLEALDKNASYLDIQADGDSTVIMTIGYEPVSTNHTQTDVEAPLIKDVVNKVKGQLRARIVAQKNVKSYVGHIKPSTGTDFGPSISFQNSKSIIFSGLTAGVTYIFELMAIGGSNGQSSWSDPAQGMAQ